MLNSHREPPGWEQDPPAQAVSLLETVSVLHRMLRRQVVPIVVAVVLGAALAYLYVEQVPPAYTAEASILIEARKVQLFSKSAIYDDTAYDNAGMETQLEILRSDKTILDVIDKLHLANEPEFIGAPESLITKLRRLLERVVPLHLADDSAKASPSAADKVASAMLAFQSRLDVSRVGSSYAILIRFRSSDAARAAEVANGLADAFIEGQRQARLDGSSGAAAWLRQRLQELHQQSLAADQAVIDFKVRNKIVAAQGQLLNDQELSSLTTEAVAARERTSAAQARLDRIEEVIAANEADPKSSATVTDAMNNPVITKLRSETLELSTRLNDWSGRFGSDHLAVRDLRQRLIVLRSAMMAEMKRVGETYRSDLQIARQRQDSVERQIRASTLDAQATNQAQTTLRGLEGAAQTYATLSASFLQRYTEIIQQQSFPMSETSIIAHAPVPFVRSQPKTKFLLSFGTLAGLMLGCGFGFLRETLDGVFRTVAQVEKIVQAECVAMVPLTKATLARRRTGRNSRPGGDVPQPARTIHRGPEVIWNIIEAPHSSFAESFRALKASIDARGRRSQVVVGITSALPNEGKSVTAGALAVLMAGVGARVLLVDGDLRNPSLTRQLAAGATRGLLDVVAGRSSLSEVVWRDPSTTLSFLPGRAGSLPHQCSEFFATREALALFEKLRSDYDYVVLDLPPMMPLMDVRTTTGIVDYYAFVIEWGATKVHVVEQALKSTRVVQDNLLGLVLSKVDLRRLQRYEQNFQTLYSPGAFARYSAVGDQLYRPPRSGRRRTLALEVARAADVKRETLAD